MDKSLKRKADTSETNLKLEICPHKDACYRRNPHHFKQFDHPHLVKFIEMGDSLVIPENTPQPKQVYLEQIEILKPILKTKAIETRSVKKPTLQIKSEMKANDSNDASTSKNNDKTILNRKNYDETTMLEKFEKTKPYNLFFTTIPKSLETLKHFNSVTFTDILCPSLGQLKCSLQINFMIDIDWLLKQYKSRNLHLKPLTILYGDDWPDMVEFMDKFCPSVKYKLVTMKDPFGCHHSKIGIYAYENGSIRVVVSTANLYYEDWNHYNQGLWMSPECPKLPEGSSDTAGESPTGFKTSLLTYLKTYNLQILNEWIDYVKKADFTAVRTFLVFSSPGKYYQKSSSNGSHIHRVGDLLSRHCVLPTKTTPQSEGPLSWGVIAQASSIGSMGKNAGDWLRSAVLRSLASHTRGALPNSSNATLSVVYPSVDNVANGYFGLQSGGCLPYSKTTNEKQRWLQDYLHQWKADGLNRTKAMPHIKSYCRVSPCMTKLAYFLLTSANLSKSAWGGNIGKDGGVYVRSYECGVMFLPKFFDEEFFEIVNTLNNKNSALFPLMYDLPLTPYKSDDYPWCN